MKAEFKPADINIVYFGTPQFSVPSLYYLKKTGYNIVTIVTQPDKPQGRGHKLSPSPVKVYAIEKGIKHLTPDKLDNDFIKQLPDIKADLFIVVAYGNFLPQEIINLPKFGTLNIHPSLLPKYRGPSPIQWALLSGDKQTGNSLMLIDKEMDHGPLIIQSKVGIDAHDNTETLSQKLSLDAGQLLIDTLPSYIIGKIKTKEQDHGLATFSKLITKQDGIIDWQDTAQNILNKIRAYNPWPVVQVEWNNKILKIYNAQIGDKKLISGQIDIDKIKNKVYIGTDTQTLEILELQLPGKKRLAVKEFINGLK